MKPPRAILKVYAEVRLGITRPFYVQLRPLVNITTGEPFPGWKRLTRVAGPLDRAETQRWDR